MQGREIKFRIWDKDLKKMRVCGTDIHDSIAFDMDNNAVYYNMQNGCGSLADGTGTYDLMQFTGLRDKNGKEIYEGDVVRVKNGAAVEEAPEYIRAEIIWGEGYFDFNHKHIPEFDSDDYSTYYFIYPPFSYKAEELEVIGNIYENPELLEVEK